MSLEEQLKKISRQIANKEQENNNNYNGLVAYTPPFKIIDNPASQYQVHFHTDREQIQIYSGNIKGYGNEILHRMNGYQSAMCELLYPVGSVEHKQLNISGNGYHEVKSPFEATFDKIAERSRQIEEGERQRLKQLNLVLEFENTFDIKMW